MRCDNGTIKVQLREVNNMDYSEKLKDIMALIINNTEKEALSRSINSLKDQLYSDIHESQNALSFLDVLIKQYLNQQNMGTRHPSTRPSDFVPDDRKERISYIANHIMKDGSVNTKDIITELRKTGEQNTERVLRITIGNILNKRGWLNHGGGKYVKTEVKQ
jgi:hypothetical protein